MRVDDFGQFKFNTSSSSSCIKVCKDGRETRYTSGRIK